MTNVDLNPKRRARQPAAKDARRQDLLQAAAQLWNQNIGGLTMDKIAQQANLAKGTTYLYFSSKEELFLVLLGQELENWFENLDLELEQSLHHTPKSLAHLVTESLQNRQRLMDLLSIQASILEKNIGFGAAKDFRTMLAMRTARTSILLEHALQLPSGAGAELLQSINALVVGFWQPSPPSPVVRQVLELPNFAALRVEFQAQFARTLETLLHGLEAQQRKP